MSKYLKKFFTCGADFWMVENKGGGKAGGGGKAANSADHDWKVLKLVGEGTFGRVYFLDVFVTF